MKIAIKNIIVSIISMLFGLALIELFLRYTVLESRYNFKCFAADTPVKSMLEKQYHIFRPSNILGYEHIPNSSPFINSYGMVGRYHELDKKKNTFRILVLGDSITQDNWYVEKMEDRLNSSGLDYKFELWNAAVPGYEINQYFNYLRYNGLKYNPDMILIGLCLNDFNWNSIIVYYKDDKGFTQRYCPSPYLQRVYPINAFLFKYLYLYRFSISRIESLLSQLHKKELGLSQRQVSGLYFLGGIKNICNRKGLLLACVVFPYLKPLIEYNDKQKRDYESMVWVLKRLDIDFIDMHLYIPDEKRKELRMNQQDDIHPSKAGHMFVADIIYEFILNNYFHNII